MKLLVVEDEESVARYLEQSLRDLQFQVSHCRNLEALDKYLENSHESAPTVIILDRLLYGKDSAPRIPAIKKMWPMTKILVLSAVGGPSEKSKILDSGADDYISKPFSIDELGARIRVLLRRPHESSSPVVSLGNLVLNPLSQLVEVDGQRLELSRKEFLLLALMMQNPSRVFSRIQLLDRIWDIHNDVESNVVEATIKNLRKKLDASKANVRVMSKRFMGYWIEA